MPPPLPGFEHVRRSWNNQFQSYAARILPGEFYVTRHKEGVATTLGSCISACIRDRVSGIGGMNHFMLPATEFSDLASLKAANLSDATRFGNYAMEHLINEIMRNGGRRQNLEVKLFGGGRIISNMTDVGLANITFVRDYLDIEGLPVVAEDVGDIFPRMVMFFPATGVAKVKRLRSLHTNTIADQERQYIDSIKKQPVSGEVELF
ncbi:MAG: chemoreceptor glutamine deamidase CheD [Thiobacillus sp.]|nr:chemoreceptor glutamine deamidase CheD [Thiobacillus sp.]